MSDQRTKNTGEQGYRSVTDGDLSESMPLEEFLSGVGVVMRLPQKEGEKPPSPAAPVVATPSPKRGGRRIVVAVCATLSAVLIAIVALRKMDSSYSDVLPATLIGSWHTDAPKFRDRGFTVRSEALTIQRGPKPSDVVTLPITSVRVRSAQRGRSVAISYKENGAAQTLTLTLEDLDGMSIVELQNQPEIVWRRK